MASQIYPDCAYCFYHLMGGGETRMNEHLERWAKGWLFQIIGGIVCLILMLPVYVAAQRIISGAPPTVFLMLMVCLGVLMILIVVPYAIGALLLWIAGWWQE